jgi:hypothetical protein
MWQVWESVAGILEPPPYGMIGIDENHGGLKLRAIYCGGRSTESREFEGIDNW